ncbi:MAG: hypothetical protein JSV09_12460 [Thermoplasmata archaeon]|nr:MAG: hypothetical protein JSV09_12460 [Thermoplasmata archaeon]
MKSNISVETEHIEISEKESNYNPIMISNLISDKYVSKILMSTFKKPKSVQNISASYGIPIAVCYRKVRQLENLGFLTCIGDKLNGNGKRVKLYQSQIVNAHFFMEKGKFRARVQLSSGAVDDYGGSWSIADEPKQ